MAVVITSASLICRCESSWCLRAFKRSSQRQYIASTESSIGFAPGMKWFRARLADDFLFVKQQVGGSLLTPIGHNLGYIVNHISVDPDEFDEVQRLMAEE